MTPHSVSLVSVVTAISREGIRFPHVPISLLERSSDEIHDSRMSITIRAWLRLENRQALCLFGVQWRPDDSWGANVAPGSVSAILPSSSRFNRESVTHVPAEDGVPSKALRTCLGSFQRFSSQAMEATVQIWAIPIPNSHQFRLQARMGELSGDKLLQVVGLLGRVELSEWFTLSIHFHPRSDNGLDVKLNEVHIGRVVAGCCPSGPSLSLTALCDSESRDVSAPVIGYLGSLELVYGETKAGTGKEAADLGEAPDYPPKTRHGVPVLKVEPLTTLWDVRERILCHVSLRVAILV
jgi:hypothetical protein